ncbi:MAG: DUF4920 domain-containing protein [Gammaproteobacteria bacterium]|nr:DUF4920 domain-containing protein [Gammaproteobacteria bacterium]
MKFLTSLLLLIVFCSPVFAKTYGSGAKMNKLIAISTLLDKPEKYLDKNVTVEGTIVAVCSSRGCWMKLASDKKFQTLRIKVKDGDMVFPLTAKGKIAYATGQLHAIELDKEKAIEYLSHLAEEANEKFDKTSITAGITIYQLVPQGVTIAD